MPKYDFVCTKCNHVFEIDKKMNEIKEHELCPRCNYMASRIWNVVNDIWKCPDSYKGENRKGNINEG
jgi:putative FmdB family regulatory protein